MSIRKPKYWGAIKPPVGFGVDWSDPINNGLKGCWLVNEGAGNKLYDIVNKNHGTFANGPTWQPGKFGTALLFNGTNQYVDAGSPAALDITASISVSIWVKRTANTSGSLVTISRGYDGSATQYSLTSDSTLSPSYAMYFGTFSGGTFKRVISNTAGALNVWEHWIGTYDGATYRIYRNGILDNSTASGTAPVHTAKNVYIGAVDTTSAGGVFWWPGSLDAARIYNRALNGAECARLYSEPFAGILRPRQRLQNGSNLGIQFDTAGNSGDQAAASSYSGSATWNGTNRFLAVDVSMLGAGVTVTAMTYGGAACTFIGAQSTVTSFGRIEQWRIKSSDSGAPAAGSNTLSITLSGSLEFSAEWVSYTGVHQTSPTEGFNSAQATNTGSATDASVAVTPIANNCWIHAAVVANDTSIAANQTDRNNISGTLGSGANEDTGPVTPASSTSMSYTHLGITTTWAIAGYAIRPVAASILGGIARVFAYVFG